VKTFLCPSDNPDAAVVGTFVIWITYPTAPPPSTSATMTGYYFNGSFGHALGKTDYIGVQGAIGRIGIAAWDNREGIFLPQIQNNVGAISSADGTANTLMFGESLGGTFGSTSSCNNDPNGGRDFAMGWIGAGALPVAWGLTDPPCWYTFSSKHTGVVQFCYGDGSVRPVRKGVDNTNFRAAAGWHDGIVYDPGALGN
jgi:hypothetical protein